MTIYPFLLDKTGLQANQKIALIKNFSKKITLESKK